jgi:hypothetical protein
MGILGKRALFEPLRSINATTFTGSFIPIGTPLANPSVWLLVLNDTTVTVLISDDGVNPKFALLTVTSVVIDISSDAQSTSGSARLSMPQNTQLYVSATAGTGLLYVSTMYAGG